MKGTQAEVIKALKKDHGITCSRTIISRLSGEDDERIIKFKNGKIRVKETVAALVESGFGRKAGIPITRPDGTKGETTEEPARNGQKLSNEDLEKIIQEHIDGKPITLQTPRVVVEKYKAIQSADKDRIANEIKLGLYHPKDEIEEKSFELFRTIRDKSKTGFEKAALKMRSAKSTHEARQIAETEHHKIFSSVIAEYDQSDETVKKKLLQLLTGST